MNRKSLGYRVWGIRCRTAKLRSSFAAFVRAVALNQQHPNPQPPTPNPSQQGFALLLTLVVVSVILAIGLSLLFVTTKQYLLAVTAVESEKAFQAGQIGLECLRYHRSQSPGTREQLLKEDNAPPPALSCAGVSSANLAQSGAIYEESGRFLYNYRYRYEIDIAGSRVCAEPSLYIADLRGATEDLEYNISTRGEGLGTIVCTAGTICTAIFARGYNRPCDQLDSIFTVQREITVEF